MKCGHGPNLARVFGYLRRERLGDFVAEDVIELVMVQADNNQIILQFWATFGGILGSNNSRPWKRS